jgi:glycosyltransferase involved in cell wall biosynthesis
MLVDGLGLSGKTRTLVHLALGLDHSRFRAVVCTYSTERSVLTAQLESAGIPVHTLPARDGLDLGALSRTARLVRTIKADLVHCYNPRPILYGGIAARVRGVGATVGSLSAFACQVPDREYDFLPQPLATASRRNVYRNRIAAGTMQYLVTVSPSLGKRFCEYNHVPLAKLRVVPYGADLSAIESVSPEDARALRTEIGAAPDDLVVGSVGRLVEQKDYPTQLRAFATAVRRAPRLRMVLAGDGPLEANIRTMIQEFGVQDRVTLIGHCSRVPVLLRALDVFVMASKFEPYGVALLEAKAAGLPIVATRVNEIPEIIEDGRSGLLAAPGEPDEMANLLIRLAEERGLRERLGSQALVDARERHGIAAAVRAYQDVYEAALN